MENIKKTKKQLIEELESSQHKVAELEKTLTLNNPNRLTRKERLYLEVINRSPLSIWASKCAQDDFEVVLWNKGAEEIYHVSEEDAIGKNYLTLIVSKEERPQSAIDCNLILEGEVFRNFLADDTTRDGQPKQMLTNCYRIWDADEQQYLQAEIGIDISEGEFFRAERKLRTIREMGIYQNIGQTLRQMRDFGKESSLQNILRDLFDLIREYVPGSQSFVYLYNSKFNVLDSLPIASSVIQPNSNITSFPELPKAILDKFSLFRKKSSRGLSINSNIPVQEDDKVAYALRLGDRLLGLFVIQLSDNSILSSENEFAIGTAVDIVAVSVIIKTFFEESQQKADENERLASQLKERFGEIAHQLRSPITEMKGFTQLIAKGRVTDPETQKEYFTIILAAIEGLEARINDMLSVKKIESGQLKFSKHSVSIKKMIEKVIRLFQYSIEIKKINITMNLDHVQDNIIADEEGIKSALQVLVENAIHYSPDESTLTISTWNDAGMINISITDNGMGISSEEMDNIFEKYYRGETAIKNRPEGLGVGLTIAKYIITEGHAGKISVTSKLGNGSTFTISLPIN